ncbi:MAG TPA: FAD-dependent oxidoreductase, partial [Saprospiraceae bacterium]|nr:FAD-dependent oxidoreductase [Saprospiraceae bacterium]
MELQQKSGDTYDYVIIGSGIAGLICAAYLSKKGNSVIVLEKNQQIGGCLQVFSRDKKILDTGVHYIGGLGKDQSLYQLFHFLGIIEELEFSALDEECFDRIIITSSGLQVDLAQGWERFERKMVE